MACFDPYNPDLFEYCCCCCDDPHVQPGPPIPTDGLILWANDESIQQSGGFLTAWNDLSGNSNNLTPNTLTWPISSQNGLPCLGVISAWNSLTKVGLNGGPVNKRAFIGAANFSVGAATTATRLAGIVTSQSLADLLFYSQLSSGTYKLVVQTGGVTAVCNLPGIAVGQPIVWSVWNTAIGNNVWNFRAWYGSTKITFQAPGISSPQPQTTYTGLYRPDNTNRYWNQKSFELAMYAREFNDEDSTTWYEYLNEKWALGITAPP